MLSEKEVFHLPTVKCILAEQGGKGGGGGTSIVLRSIEVTTPPTKTSYLAGDTFNTAGMVITASYGLANSAAILTTAEVTGSCTITPQPLTDGTTKVTISYSEGGITVSTTQNVTVTHKLTSIAVTTNPTKTTYEYGDTLATAGMVVTATYSDGKTATVTGTCSPTSLTTVGASRAITVTYSENGVTKTATFNVVVERKSVAKPTWKANLTYTGSSQSVTGTDKWNNYNTTYMTIGGTTSATNAGTNGATFTLGSNYRWADGTTDVLTVNWTINKATGSFGLSATTASINASNYSSGATITVTNPTGTITVTSSNNTACPVSLSGNTITIKGDGKTAGTYTITVKCAASTNYTAPSDKTITVTIAYWSWGTETDIGDATWWNGLKAALPGMTAAERSALVGKKKKLTISEAFLGVNANQGISVICIGADQDGANTLAFQTEGLFPTQFAYSTNRGGNDASVAWEGSTAQTHCNTFASKCSASAAMKSVTKTYSSVCNNNQNNSADKSSTGKAWCTSDCEMGFVAGAGGETTEKGQASSYSEWTSGGTQTAYSYYTDHGRRKKLVMDANGNITTSTSWYWERSRYYGTRLSGSMCAVSDGGSPGSSYYSTTYGRLAPAFVIG